MANIKFQHNGLVLSIYSYNLLKSLVDSEWHDLSACVKTAVKRLFDNDLIQISVNGTQRHYSITTRGLSFIQAVESRASLRHDKMCAKCNGARARYHYSTGRLSTWCKECTNAYRSESAKKIKKIMCALCGEQPRYYSPNTLQWKAYCKSCLVKKNQEYAQRAIQRVQAENKLCAKCGQNQRYTSLRYVDSLCRVCMNERGYAQVKKRKIAMIKRKLGRVS